MVNKHWQFQNNVTLSSAGPHSISVRNSNHCLTLNGLVPGMADLLRELREHSISDTEWTERLFSLGGPTAIAQGYYYLQELMSNGFLVTTLIHPDGVWLSLEPMSKAYRIPLEDRSQDKRKALSRFALLRSHNGRLVLESPLALARVTLFHSRAVSLIQALASPDEAGPYDADGAAFYQFLANEGFLTEIEPDGTRAEETDRVLSAWEFHDLLFHSRSRIGRTDSSFGGTFLLAKSREAPPACKPVDEIRNRIDLYRPDLDKLKVSDPPLAWVQEERKSERCYGDNAISVREVGEFLFRVGRVREWGRQKWDTPFGTKSVEVAKRPYPGGGGLYELEIYVAVNRCQGLEPGLYHYEPMSHQLTQVSGKTGDLEGLLSAAGWACKIEPSRLQVEFILASRIERLTWKYSAMAYAATLKHVGVIYQTMYLCATAMGLAACALGAGDSDLFARASGNSYFEEMSVGEFLLGSRAHLSPNRENAKC